MGKKKVMGINHEVNLPKISHKMTMGQHWLGKTKPKKTFRSTQKAFKKLLRNYIIFNEI